jgi:hypothetical protein
MLAASVQQSNSVKNIRLMLFLLFKFLVKKEFALPYKDDGAEDKQQQRMNHLAVRVSAENFH